MKAQTRLSIIHFDSMSGNPIGERRVFCGDLGAATPDHAFFRASPLVSNLSDYLRPRHLAGKETYAQRVEKTEFGCVDDTGRQIGIT